jgi:MFS family permease
LVALRKGKRLFYGWWIVGASAVLFIFAGGTTLYGFTAFFNPINREFGWTRAVTSLAFTLRDVEGGIAQPIAGFTVDRVGPRRLILFGMVVLGLGFVLMSRINSLGAFFGTFAIVALGMSAGLGMGQYAAVANWFVRKRALALGLISTGYGLSGAMTPVLVWLIDLYGWRSALVILGVAMWAIGIPLALVIRDKPQKYGYLPDGADPGDLPSAEPASPTPAAGLQGKPGLSAKEAIRTRTFWLLISFYSLTGLSLAALWVHEIPYLTDVGISAQTAALTMTGITLASLLGRLGFAWLGDLWDKRALLAAAMVLQSIGVLIFAYVESPWSLIPFILTFGPGYAGVFPLVPALQADYYGLKAFGSIRGLLTVGWAISGVGGPLLAGWIYDVTGGYRLAFLLFAAATFTAIPVALAMRPPHLGLQR